MRTLSIVIPTWERVEMTIASFFNVVNDERIEKIVIVDDASSDETYLRLKTYCDRLPKVLLYRNETNKDCYRNKATSVSYSPTPFCIILDSDNIIDTDYIDKIFEQEWDEKTALMPSFAYPHFSYEAYNGVVLDKENAANYIDLPLAETCLNCMNYFVNKHFYMKVWDGSIDPVTSDSLYQNYNWLLNGGKIHIVEGLRYIHTIHENSHYLKNNHRTPTDFRENIMQKIRNFKKEVLV